MSWNNKTIPFKMTGSSNQLLMYNPIPGVFFFLWCKFGLLTGFV